MLHNTVASPPPLQGPLSEASLVDRVWIHQPTTQSADGTVTLLLHRRADEDQPSKDFALYFRYPLSQMKQLTTWSHMVKGEYICGLEPGNANMLGREWHRANNFLEELPPGGKRTFSIEIGVVEGREALAATLEELGYPAAEAVDGPDRASAKL